MGLDGARMEVTYKNSDQRGGGMFQTKSEMLVPSFFCLHAKVVKEFLRPSSLSVVWLIELWISPV